MTIDAARVSAGVDADASIVTDENVVLGYSPSGESEDPLLIGDNARIRSGTVVYAGAEIGQGLATGHNVTIHAEVAIGDDVSIWTDSVIERGCRIGNRVKIHSGCYVAQSSVIEDDAFLAPGVILAADGYPGFDTSADVVIGPHIESGAQVGVNATVLPHVRIGAGAIIGAGSVVTSDIPAGAVAYGNPAVVHGAVEDLGNVGERVPHRAAGALTRDPELALTGPADKPQTIDPTAHPAWLDLITKFESQRVQFTAMD